MAGPRKLYIETTTRCNLACEKCIKQMPESRITERDFPVALFERLLPHLAGVETLIVNGIGEPLLYPHLAEIIRGARAVMPAQTEIGFQSNGGLMTRRMAERLVAAGVSTVCFSVDSVQPANALTGTTAPSAQAVASALHALGQADQAGTVRRGLEIVVSTENIVQLPDLVRWGAGHGVAYILVSHLFAYDAEMADKSLFSPVPLELIRLYEKYRQRALEQGIDWEVALQEYQVKSKTGPGEGALHLLDAMRRELQGSELSLHLPNLLAYDAGRMHTAEAAFSEAEEAAAACGISLSLPPLHAQIERSCPFIEDEAVFISVGGEVMPCHFVWHSYDCMAGSEVIRVEERSFGNLEEASLDQIWNGAVYRQFREEARRAEYSRCWGCPQGPCADVVNNNLLAANDCHSSIVPCGHCRWSIGGLRCL